jgi:hypothetical protein
MALLRLMAAEDDARRDPVRDGRLEGAGGVERRRDAQAWKLGVPITAGTDSIGVDTAGALPIIHGSFACWWSRPDSRRWRDYRRDTERGPGHRHRGDARNHRRR